MTDFKYIFELQPHFGEIKSVVLVTDDLVCTTSSDGFAVLLRREEKGPPYFSEENRFILEVIDENGPQTYNIKRLKPVYDACYAEPMSEKVTPGSYNSGFLATANGNGKVYLYGDTHCSEPKGIIDAHMDVVCCLDAPVMHGERYLVSGSWDCRASIWKDNQLIANLSSHKGSVLSTCSVYNEITNTYYIVTASADSTLIAWEIFFTQASSNEDTKEVMTSAAINVVMQGGHEGPVRKLVYCKDTEVLVSAGNDMRICVWDAKTFELLFSKKEAHDSFIYSLCIISANASSVTIATSGEDSVVKVWAITLPTRDIKLQQTIFLPAGVSLWGISYASRPYDQLLVACSDNTLRVFSRNSNDVNNQVNAQFERASEESHNLYRQQVAEASIPKKMNYNDKEYDFVFDVDIVDNAAPLKLPFNKSENPFVVAKKFVATNNLDSSFIEQTAQFIITSAGLKNSVDDSTKIAATASFNPNQVFVRFENKNTENVFKKISEFNNQLQPTGEGEVSPLKVSDQCLINVNSNSNPILAFTDLLDRLLLWPDEIVFPALDLMRIIALDRAFTPFFVSHFDILMDRIFSILGNANSIRAASITASRLLANMIHQDFLKSGDQNYPGLCDIIDRLNNLLIPQEDPLVLVAIATTVLNMSTLLLHIEFNMQHDEYKEVFFGYVSSVLVDTGYLGEIVQTYLQPYNKSIVQYEEGLYRFLVAIQNYMFLHTSTCTCNRTLADHQTYAPSLCDDSLAFTNSSEGLKRVIDKIYSHKHATEKIKSIASFMQSTFTDS